MTTHCGLDPHAQTGAGRLAKRSVKLVEGGQTGLLSLQGAANVCQGVGDMEGGHGPWGRAFGWLHLTQASSSFLMPAVNALWSHGTSAASYSDVLRVINLNFIKKKNSKLFSLFFFFCLFVFFVFCCCYFLGRSLGIWRFPG